MAVQLGSWPAYDYRPMPDGSCDQITQASRHDSDGNRARSYGEDWQTLASQLESNSGITAEDLAMFNDRVHFRNRPGNYPHLQNRPHGHLDAQHLPFDHLTMPPPMMARSSDEEAQYATDAGFELAMRSMGPPPVPEPQRLDESNVQNPMNHFQHYHQLSTLPPYATGSWMLPPQMNQFASGSYAGVAYSSPMSGGAYESTPSSAIPSPSPMLLSAPYPQNAPDDPANTSNDAHDDDHDDGDSTDPCYAQLLHQALKETPGHTMSLKDLYKWVQEHSTKGKDPINKGWQNSVRHNLSMNQAFERVPAHNGNAVKKGSLWKLTDQALQHGVISTTRFRKDPKRKVERQGEKAPARVRSGAKGGQATRAATRRLQRERSLTYPQGPTSNHATVRQREVVDLTGTTPPPGYSHYYQSPDHAYTSQPSSPFTFGQESQLPNHPLPVTSNPYTPVPAAESFGQFFRSHIGGVHHGLPLPNQNYLYEEEAASYPTPNSVGNSYPASSSLGITYPVGNTILNSYSTPNTVSNSYSTPNTVGNSYSTPNTVEGETTTFHDETTTNYDSHEFDEYNSEPNHNSSLSSEGGFGSDQTGFPYQNGGFFFQ